MSTLRVRVLRFLGGLLALAYSLPATPAEAGCNQPLYVIAHRCNDYNDGRKTVVERGVNAIEADFSWGDRAGLDGIGNDDEWAVDHDGVFPHSTYLDNWLDEVAAELARPGSPLSLIILDIKDPQSPALLDLFNTVRDRLGPDINLLVSIGDWDYRVNFHKIANAIENDPRAGVAIDELGKADAGVTQAEIQEFFQSISITKYWLADGICAVCSDAGILPNLTAAMALRDSENDCGAFHGVYTWTYEAESSIKARLNSGLNGIFVNTPECNGYADLVSAWDPAEAVAFAKTLPGRKFATPEDNPFSGLLPEISCPANTTVECSTYGGASTTDPLVNAFLNSATSPPGDCNAVSVTSDAPWFFFPVDTTAVTFTATDNSICDPSSECGATLTVQDTTAPTAHCPADIAVNPVSPQGTVVSYSATATDICDANAAVSCSPASGSTFAVGTTTDVTCTAEDASQNQQACIFAVKVYSPQEVVDNLKAAASALSGSLNQGQMNSLMSLLNTILSSIEAANSGSTCGQLQGLISKLNGWISKGTLTSAQAAPLIDSATSLEATFGCY